MILLLLTVFVLSYVVLYYIKEYWKRKSSPPGPWPIPIVGNLIQLARASNLTHMALANIAAEYKEDILRLKFGSQEGLLLSSYEVLKDLSNHPDAIGRFLTGLIYDRNDGKQFGVAFSDGNFWEVKRTWVFKTLRGFGLNKSLGMESNTNGNIQEYLKQLDHELSSGKTIFQMDQMFLYHVFQTLWKMLVGRRNDKDQVVIDSILKKSIVMLKAGTFGPGLLSIFPIFKYLLPGLTGFNAHVDFAKDCKKAAKDLLREAVCNMNADSSKTAGCLTEAYALQMIKDPESKDFFEEDFELVFMDVLQGGSDTVSGFLEALVLFSVLYPDDQNKVYKEVQELFAKGEKPTYADYKTMIYTQAFFTEVHRLTLVGPLLANKRVTKDFYYRGYLIKEDTNILANVHGIYHNKKVMGEDVHDFRPQRFIDEEGKLGNNATHIIPFGIGKRICPGMAYAEVVGFLFYVNILQRYKLSTVPGQPRPTTKMEHGITSKPCPFEICIEKRT